VCHIDLDAIALQCGRLQEELERRGCSEGAGRRDGAVNEPTMLDERTQIAGDGRQEQRGHINNMLTSANYARERSVFTAW